MRESFRRSKSASWGIGEEVLERGDGPVDHGASDESRGGGPEIQPPTIPSTADTETRV